MLKDIPNYEGLYAASDDGHIWSYRSNKFLKATGKAHLMLTLCKNKVQTPFYVHRLIAMTYIPNPDNLPCVNHKDENPKNNAVSNLEWCTPTYNINYGTAKERIAEKHTGKKLSEEHKASIRNTCQERYGQKVYCVELDKVFNSISEAKRETGATWVSACVKGMQKSSGGYHFRYVEEE